MLYQGVLCLKGSYGGESEIVGLEWYSGQEGFCEPGCPVLAVGLRTGQLQLMTDELDDTCRVVNTGMQVSNIKWNSNGSVLAVSGVILNNGNSAAAVVQFYSCYGEHATAVRCSGMLPGKIFPCSEMLKGVTSPQDIAVAYCDTITQASCQWQIHDRYSQGTSTT